MHMCSYNVKAHWNYANQVNLRELRNVSKGRYFLYVVTPAGLWPQPSCKSEIHPSDSYSRILTMWQLNGV